MAVFAQNHLQRVGYRGSWLAVIGKAILHNCRCSAAKGAVPNQFQIGHCSRDIAGTYFTFCPVKYNFGITQQYLVLANRRWLMFR